MSFESLEALMVARTPIEVKFGYVTADSATFALDTNKKVRTGDVIITALELTSERGGICTSSITLQGNGELA